MGSFPQLFASGGWTLLGTAALLGLGVAIVQAGVIKQRFPERVSIVTGLYSSMLMGGGALGARIAPVIADAWGTWPVGLAWLALPALISMIMAIGFLPKDGTSQVVKRPTGAVLRRPRTWVLMVCFGLVNGGYFSVVAWLAPSYQDHGWSSAASGSLLAVMATNQALSALIIPALASKGEDRRPWLWVTLSTQAAGFAGLAFQPEAAPAVWAVLIGAGLRGCFALSIVVALDHLPDPMHAGALSALMQGGGFLIAAIPPWIVAVLHDLTGSFLAGWLLHLCSVVLVTTLMARLSPGGYARAMTGGTGREEPATSGLGTRTAVTIKPD